MESLTVLLFGKDMTFYDLLEAQAAAAVRAAETFHALSQDFAHSAEHIHALDEIEHEADELTHQLARRTDTTFVTPLDKEDLQKLSSNLDDVTDAIEAAAARIAIYRLTAPRPDIEPLVRLLVEITQAVHEAVGALRHGRDRNALQPRFIRIHEIENESDTCFRKALTDLFDTPNPDPLMVIKWKEIYDRIESAVDKCEDVANVVESVVVKYA